MTAEELARLVDDGEVVSKVSLAGANLAGGSFLAANFDHVDFNGADLRGAKLGQSNFVHCSLTGANLEAAALGRVEN